jgi:O-antigen/teichoic acid export membrane protein
MPGFKRAFMWASAGRYVVTVIGFATTIIMARLLSPGEYGLSVLGSTVFLVADAIRGLAGGAYLVQTKELSSDKIRTSCTVSLIVTLVMASTLAFLARPIAAYYATPELERYLQVIGISYLMGPFSLPIMALMTREMAFERLALIGVVTTVVSGTMSIVLASLGFSAMSYAWASVASAAAGVLLCFFFYPDLSIFRPLLREWRSVLRFGVFDSATTVLNRLTENLFYLILGRLLNVQAVGLWQRAFSLSGFPEKVILAGFGAVALPAFSEKVRSGQGLKDSYLSAIEYITAVQWPAMMLLAFLAHPIVEILLGQQWLDVAPILQIIAGALVFNFAVTLEYPTLVATGAIRYLPAIVLTQASIFTGLVWFGATSYGLYGAAMSLLVIVPVNAFISVLVVRSQVRFSCGELAGALRKSAVLLVLSAAGPAITLIGAGWRADVSMKTALVSMILCVVGWIYGLRLTRHPLGRDVFGARDALLKTPVATRVLAAGLRLFR